MHLRRSAPGGPFFLQLFANEPEMLVRWIRDAPSLDPATAMPKLGVSEQQARDIAAYLYSR